MIGHVFVILPGLNEQESLSELLPQLAKQIHPISKAFTLCVVSDGSTDGTKALCEGQPPENHVRLLVHPQTMGYGAALRTGFRWVLERAKPEDVIVTLDADRTHDPKYIPDLIAKLAAGSDVVTASYSLGDGRAVGVPGFRRILSLGAFFILWCAAPVSGLTTYTNGFRAYRASILLRVYSRFGDSFIEENGFAGGTELFLKAVQVGAKVAEIPFVLRYDRRGTSRIRLGRTILGYLRLARKSISWRRIA